MEQDPYTKTPNEEPEKNDPLAADDSFADSDVYNIYEFDKKQTVYSIYLSESIENNFKYTKLLHDLRHTKKTDKVNLYLANYGGSCSSGFQIINALKDCSANVSVIVDAPCYSMGAILAVCGNSLIMNPGTFLMFHNYSTMEIGKGLEVRDAINHYFEYFHKHLDLICYPFLTKDELRHLKNDKDVYVSWDDPTLGKRVKRHFK